MVIDVSTDRQDSGLPTEAYVAVDQVREDGKPVEKTWKHLSSAVGAEEAEEVGVEQLLRDVYNPTAGSLRYTFIDRQVSTKNILVKNSQLSWLQLEVFYKNWSKFMPI